MRSCTVLPSVPRRIGIHRLARGDSGRTVVWCHPSPGAGTLDPDPAVTASRGVSLLGVDRPGYGDSAPVAEGEWATVDLAAEDIAEVLLRDGTGPVGAVGWDAGGWTALALAARHPDMVDRVALLATPAPESAVPWMPADLRETLAALTHAGASEARRRIADALAGRVPAKLASDRAFDLLARSPADAGTLASVSRRTRLGQMLAAAFAGGIDGYATDVAGYGLRPWGFRVEDVKARTLLLYGSKDPVCASRHGRWWQSQLPNARLEMAPGAGHLLVFSRWPRVMSHLAPGLARRT